MKPVSTNHFRTMCVIWGYDIIKFLMAFNIMQDYSINPWIFFFLDMVTVPPYVMGWSRLIASLTGEIQPFRAMLTWSLITLFSSTAPYLYAAVAGRQTLPGQAWIILILILIFMFINLIRKICRIKKNTCPIDI